VRTGVIVVLSALVVVSGCVSLGQYNQEVQKSKAYELLSQELQTEVTSDQVQIQQLQDRLKVTMLNEILFPEGGWEIHQQGKKVLNKIIPTLTNLQGKRIQVQGFTDNLPIAGELRMRFPSNWELSAARAADVVRYLQQQGVAPTVLEVCGFSEYQPAVSNDTPQGRAKNRRIEIVIVSLNQ
jgi:chemotaxis protein MotB